MQLLRLEQLQGWKEMQSEKLSSSLQPGIASVSKKLKCLVRLRSNALVSRRGPFKQVYWTLFKRTSDCRWEQAFFEFLALSKYISIYCEEKVAVLKQDHWTSFFR